MRATVSRVEEVGVVLEGAGEALAALREDEGEVELGAALVGLQRRAASRPGQLQRRPRGAFWRANITWKRGERLRSRAGLQLLDQLLEGEVLVGVGAEGRLAHAAQQLRGRRGRRRGARAGRGC